jgi:hypothetical protein
MIFPANQVWQDSFDPLRQADPRMEASLYQTSPPVARITAALIFASSFFTSGRMPSDSSPRWQCRPRSRSNKAYSSRRFMAYRSEDSTSRIASAETGWKPIFRTNAAASLERGSQRYVISSIIKSHGRTVADVSPPPTVSLIEGTYYACRNSLLQPTSATDPRRPAPATPRLG